MAAMVLGWKTVRAVTIWVAATALSIGVSWFGVRPVLDAAVPDRLVAFPVREVDPPSVPPPPTSAGPSGRSSLSRGGQRSAPPGAPPSASTSPSTVDGWTPLGDGTYLRSFRLVGGEATVRAGRDQVELISATPNPGFVMTVMPGGADRAVVNFTTALHVSTLDAWWQGDAPTARVTEIP
jgi:hypothetical protein